MKIIIGVVVLALLVCGLFFYLGIRSARQSPVALSEGVIPICGAKPNCVCSLQDPDDNHYIEPIDLGRRGASDVEAAIEAIGGKILSGDGVTIQAVFTSGIFRFVDDLLVQIDNGQLHVRSSSRVGHGDLGANRKRIEALREALS